MLSKTDQQIKRLIQMYFEGLHFADTSKLELVFSPDCILKAPGIRRTQSEWLALVKSRPVPADAGAPFAYQIIDIECMGKQAMVKAYVPLLGNEFIDYLGLLYENGQWQIVFKMYAQQP